MPTLKNKKVLVCPLDWGIGHAARLVPVINELIDQGFHVIIGANNQPLEFLKGEFPNLEFVPFPGTKINYPANSSMALKMFLSSPKLLWGILKEHYVLKKIVKRHHIQLIISDNRYGLWHSKIPSVFITHQIGIKSSKSLPFLSPLLLEFSKFFIHKFNQLWIPDYEKEPNLSGSLSHGYHIKTPLFFIGPLSRFRVDGSSSKASNKIMAIISGPEPQRSIFEKLVLSELKNYEGEKILLRGKPELKEVKEEGNLKIYSHLPTPEFSQHLQESKYIICRSGYCTLMDLAVFNKKAVIIPTPGQTEQEYLAERLFKKGVYYSQLQSEFSLDKALKHINSYSGIQLNNDYNALKNCIQNLSSN